MTKKGTENMSAQVSMNDMDVRIVKPSDIKDEVNYAFNRKRPIFLALRVSVNLRLLKQSLRNVQVI